MKKLVFGILLTCSFAVTKGQMISVSGGNLTLHKQDKGFVEVEAMADLTKKVAAHVSLTKTIGGNDIAMVGARYAPWNNLLGVSLSACYMTKHDVMPMYGVDIQLSKQLRFVFNSSFDSDLRTIGFKIPVVHLNKSH